jgi:tRNA (guanine37-N1)-methyltransferase
MRFDILTIFPELFAGPLNESIIKRAIQAGHISVGLHDIRAYATDRHRTTDDAPYGGGAGMVMKAAPLAAAIRDVLQDGETGRPRDWETGRPGDWETGRPGDQETGRQADNVVEGQNDSLDVTPSPLHPLSPSFGTLVVLMAPAGELFTQRIAEELAGYERIVLVCGRYEGVDERVREALIDRELSIGDYVLTGGELAAMVVLDAVTRLVPGVIDAASTAEESHSDGLLEYPHYTRPAVWEGRAVPPVLLSGHHGRVAAWRRQQQLRRTLERRPDLLAQARLTPADREYLRSLGWEMDDSDAFFNLP